MVIIGAGISGMLAAQYFRSKEPVVVERKESLPNNHKALLRFRSDSVSNLTGIRFKKVKVSKIIVHQGKRIAESNFYLNNMYSMKVTGSIRSRSAINLDTVERYIAPEYFVKKLSKGLNIQYDTDAASLVEKQMEDDSEPMISTMPINVLADMLSYPLESNPRTTSIWTLTFNIGDLDIDVYQTIYYPNPDIDLYRLSITGKKVIAEFNQPITEDEASTIVYFLEVDFAISGFEIDDLEVGYQKHGKLIHNNNDSIKDFIGTITRDYNIYSLGRWATHRQILMDDVVKDIRIIDNMISTNQYGR